jgi:dienelactone hydrolase
MKAFVRVGISVSARFGVLVLLGGACSSPADSPANGSLTDAATPTPDVATQRPPSPEPGVDAAAQNNPAPEAGDEMGMPPSPPDATGADEMPVSPPPSADSGGPVVSADASPPTPGVLPNFPGTKAPYGNGYFKFSFPANGHTIDVYAPPKPRDGLPWVWHGEFPDVIPNTNNAWLAKGLMIVYVNGASEQYGCPDVVKVWEAAYATLVGTYHMAHKMVITGISRGGLYAYNFAAANPDKVAGIYADNGTCDFRSWPGGRQLNDPRWTGPGGGSAWQTVLNVYHFKSTAEAIAYPYNPVDNLAPLAKGGVKLFHVTAQMDTALPWTENTGLVQDRYPKLGGSFQVIFKPNADHHPHGLEQDPSPIVNWTVATLASANGLAP